MSNPFLRLLGSVANNEGLLKDTLFRIQEGSKCEILNNIVFLMIDDTVLSFFDWIYRKPCSFFIVAKMKIIDDIMKCKGKDTMTRDKMYAFVHNLLFRKISHINTTNQPFPNIYTDEKQSVLDTSYFSPLSYEESFDVQMTRCYIHLLPDIPFILFYEDSGVNYWMAQEFHSSGSVTTTLIDNHRVINNDKLAAMVRSPSPDEKCMAYLATLLISSSSAPFHQQLFNDRNVSFAAMLNSFAVDSSFSLTPPLTTICELLLRYSPHPYSTFLIDADRFYSELKMLQSMKENEWHPLTEDVLSTFSTDSSVPSQTTSDYTDLIYQKGLFCTSEDHLITEIRQLLKAVVTLSSAPYIAPTNRTRLAEIVRKGLHLRLNCTDEIVQQWSQDIDTETHLKEAWVEAGLRSLMNRIQASFAARHLVITELTLLPEEQRDWAHHALWILSIQQLLRLLGFVCLIELTIAPEPAALQFCVNILQKAVASSSASTMLLLLPQDISSKIVGSLPAPEMMLVDRAYKSGCEAKLELNEVETRTMQFFSSKQVLEQHFLSTEETEDVRSILKPYCDEEVLNMALKNLEMRNVSLQLQDGYNVIDVSVKTGNASF